MKSRRESSRRLKRQRGDTAALLHLHDDGPHEIVDIMQLQSGSRTTERLRKQ
jgi:hypothetical protein